MAATTGQPAAQPGPRWHLLLRPRWLAWHAFVVIATVGMFFLGDWQLHRAESGNQLSWAYTFEWPLFAAFTCYFWVKSVRDELRGQYAAASVESDFAATAPGATAPGATAPGATAAAADTGNAAPVGRQPVTWDATSWDATSWGATGAAQTGNPVDLARATPADGEAYLARLKAEIHGPRRRRRRR